MLITAQEIDPQVYRSLMAGLTASFGNPNPSTAERLIHAAEREKMKGDFRPMGRWLLGGLVAASAAAASVFGFGLDSGAAIGTAIGLWNGIFWGSFAVGVSQSIRVSNRRVNTVHPDLLTKWLPLIELTRAERAYAETVVLLARPETRVPEATARNILAELNRLMEQSRHLDQQRESLIRMAGADTVEELADEENRIRARIDQTQDAQARRDLEHSLGLVAARLQSARSMAPAVERLDAQQEKIIQTLSAIQSTLARLETAPGPLDSPNVESIPQTLTDLMQQTRAVEDAVVEVMNVTAG